MLMCRNIKEELLKKNYILFEHEDLFSISIGLKG